MDDLTREDLRQHCLKTIENTKKMAEHFGFELENHKGYQEHKMVLELIKKAEKLEKIEEILDNSTFHPNNYMDSVELLGIIKQIEQIVKG